MIVNNNGISELAWLARRKGPFLMIIVVRPCGGNRDGAFVTTFFEKFDVCLFLFKFSFST